MSLLRMGALWAPDYWEHNPKPEFKPKSPKGLPHIQPGVGCSTTQLHE